MVIMAGGRDGDDGRWQEMVMMGGMRWQEMVIMAGGRRL